MILQQKHSYNICVATIQNHIFHKQFQCNSLFSFAFFQKSNKKWGDFGHLKKIVVTSDT